jgi:hypothetical protein
MDTRILRSSLPRTPSSAKSSSSRTGKRQSVSSLAEIKGSPLAGAKAPPLHRFQTPDDRDETGSVAESVTSAAPRKTEEQRMQWFRKQSDCHEVEPHRAFCGACKEWVALNPTKTYTMRPWLFHRKKCERGSTQKPYVPVPPYEPSVASRFVGCCSKRRGPYPCRRRARSALNGGCDDSWKCDFLPRLSAACPVTRP